MIKFLIVLIFINTILIYKSKKKKKIYFSLLILIILFPFNIFSTKVILVKADIYLDCGYDSKLTANSQYVISAQNSMRDTGVFASLTLAQAIQEQSLKAPDNNNMFGIKMTGTYNSREQCESAGGSWKRQKNMIKKKEKTIEIHACFKKYTGEADSFSDHGKWLLETFANRNAFKSATNLEAQLKALVSNPNAMYATGKNYLCHLIDKINACDLTRFDEGITYSARGVTIHGVHISNLSNDGCELVSSEETEIEHFSTTYGGDLNEGWIYNRLKDTEEWKQFDIEIDEADIDATIDEIFNRAKLSYEAFIEEYGETNGTGPSAGYSVKDCEEMAEETNYGDYSTWRQGYDLWSKISIGSTTLGKAGCLVTSIAIQLKAMGVDAGIENFNPGTFACYLSKNGKFTSGGALFGDWANIVPGVTLNSGTVSGTKAEQASQMQSLINQGCHLVLYAPHGGSSHFVAVSGTTSDNIKIIDPGAGKTLLWGNIYDYNNSTGYRCLKAG